MSPTRKTKGPAVSMKESRAGPAGTVCGRLWVRPPWPERQTKTLVCKKRLLLTFSRAWAKPSRPPPFPASMEKT